MYAENVSGATPRARAGEKKAQVAKEFGSKGRERLDVFTQQSGRERAAAIASR